MDRNSDSEENFELQQLKSQSSKILLVKVSTWHGVLKLMPEKHKK